MRVGAGAALLTRGRRRRAGEANNIKKGSYCVIKGFPCKVRPRRGRGARRRSVARSHSLFQPPLPRD